MSCAEDSFKEVTEPCCFTSQHNRESHFVKHVLEGRDEQWWRLLGDEPVAAARQAFRSGQTDQAFSQAARAYERLLAGHLQAACQAGQHHAHLKSLMVLEKAEVIVVQLLVYAWPIDERLFLVASAPVRNGKPAPYRLVTGYRSWPKVSRKRHVARALEKVWELNRLGRPVVAVHA